MRYNWREEPKAEMQPEHKCMLNDASKEGFVEIWATTHLMGHDLIVGGP